MGAETGTGIGAEAEAETNPRPETVAATGMSARTEARTGTGVDPDPRVVTGKDPKVTVTTSLPPSAALAHAQNQGPDPDLLHTTLVNIDIGAIMAVAEAVAATITKANARDAHDHVLQTDLAIQILLALNQIVIASAGSIATGRRTANTKRIRRKRR